MSNKNLDIPLNLELPRDTVMPRRSKIGDLFKRFFDLTVAALGMVLLAPLFFYLCLRVKRDSPGPAIYRGPRVGKDGKRFYIHKFRTMYERPDSYQGNPITSHDDPRITPFGRWLRKTKLNELPQLWNVFVGEMSLVGPRPEDPEMIKQWPEDVRGEVLSVKPGITSPASILYRHEESLLSMGEVMTTYLNDILPSKLRLDQLYVRHRSFWGDVDILFWTLMALPASPKTFQPGEKKLFLGPFSSLMRHYINWFLIDALTTLSAMALTGLIWRSLGPLNIGWPIAISIALMFSLVFSLSNVILNVHRINWKRASAADALDLIPGVIVATILCLAGNSFVFHQLFSAVGIIPARASNPLLPPTMIGMAASLAYVGFLAVRYRERLLTGLAKRWIALRGAKKGIYERVLIIGSGETGQFAAWLLGNGRFANAFRVMGFVDDSIFLQGTRIQGINVIGQRNDIPSLVRKYDIGMIVFAIHNISKKERSQILEICRKTQARLVIFPDISAAISGITRIGDKKFDQPPENRALPDTSDFFVDLETRLDQLEESAQKGNLKETLAQIQALRAHLQGKPHLSAGCRPKGT